MSSYQKFGEHIHFPCSPISSGKVKPSFHGVFLVMFPGSPGSPRSVRGDLQVLLLRHGRRWFVCWNMHLDLHVVWFIVCTCLYLKRLPCILSIPKLFDFVCWFLSMMFARCKTLFLLDMAILMQQIVFSIQKIGQWWSITQNLWSFVQLVAQPTRLRGERARFSKMSRVWFWI